MSSLFLTGASGFIGGALLRQLESSRFESVYCLVRPSDATSPARAASKIARTIPARPEPVEGRGLRGDFARFALRQAQDDLSASGNSNSPGSALPKNVQVLPGALRDVGTHSAALARCDTVVHLAALTGKARPEEYLEVNVEGTRVLLEECRRAGVKRFLYVSSIAARFPDKTVYPYARSKELAEELVARSGLRYLIVRPTIVVGAGGGAWKSLVSLARLPVPVVPGDGRARVQPIHVDDLVRCLLGVVDEDRFTGEIVEIGGPEVATFEDFLGTVRSVLRGRAPRRSLHVPLRPVIRALALLEKPLYPVLPVTAGQLSAFCNDGTARPHPITDRRAPGMKRIREMIELAARS